MTRDLEGGGSALGEGAGGLWVVPFARWRLVLPYQPVVCRGVQTLSCPGALPTAWRNQVASAASGCLKGALRSLKASGGLVLVPPLTLLCCVALGSALLLWALVSFFVNERPGGWDSIVIRARVWNYLLTSFWLLDLGQINTQPLCASVSSSVKWEY